MNLRARRKWRWLLPPAGLLLVSAWVYLSQQGPGGSFTRPDFERIRRGMTLAEVENTLEQPAELQLINPVDYSYLVVWKNDDAAAMVYFDRSGRVSRKGAFPPDRTTRDILRSRWYRWIGTNPPF
jgi:hypothetical protein